MKLSDDRWNALWQAISWCRCRREIVLMKRGVDRKLALPVQEGFAAAHGPRGSCRRSHRVAARVDRG
jgi:hypothetical protein